MLKTLDKYKLDEIGIYKLGVKIKLLKYIDYFNNIYHI